MFAVETFRPDTLLPFSSYRTPREDEKGFRRGLPELAPSLAHFYFSERARFVDDSLRRSMLCLPSASEARKQAQRIQATEHWTNNRLAIVKLALWKQFVAAPQLATGILEGTIQVSGARALGHGWETRRHGEERWRQAVAKIAELFVKGGMMNLLATGDPDCCNPFLFSTRLSVLLAEKLPRQVIIGCRAGVDAMAEQWAIQNHLPAIHLPIRQHGREAVAINALQALASAATHAIIFTKGEDLTVKRLLPILAERKIPTRLIKLDKDGRPIPKKTSTSRTTSR